MHTFVERIYDFYVLSLKCYIFTLAKVDQEHVCIVGKCWQQFRSWFVNSTIVWKTSIHRYEKVKIGHSAKRTEKSHSNYLVFYNIIDMSLLPLCKDSFHMHVGLVKYQS